MIWRERRGSNLLSAQLQNYDPHAVVLGLGVDDPYLPFLGYKDARSRRI